MEEPPQSNEKTSQIALSHQRHCKTSPGDDASKEDVTQKAPPTLIHEWIGFSPRDLSCNR
jgi:hypothetical protein